MLDETLHYNRNFRMKGLIIYLEKKKERKKVRFLILLQCIGICIFFLGDFLNSLCMEIVLLDE